MGYRLEYFLLLIPYAPHQIHITPRLPVVLHISAGYLAFTRPIIG
jgi:hypothetical protein